MARTKKFQALLDAYAALATAEAIAGRMAALCGMDPSEIPLELAEPLVAANWENYLVFRHNVFGAEPDPEQCAAWLELLQHSDAPALELSMAIHHGNKTVLLRFPNKPGKVPFILSNTSRRERREKPGSVTLKAYMDSESIQELRNQHSEAKK